VITREPPDLVSGQVHTVGYKRTVVVNCPPSFAATLVMSLLSFEFDNAFWTTCLLATALLVGPAVHLVPYVIDVRGIRTIPGPWLAKYTDVWLCLVVGRGHTSEVVHELHKKHGEHPLRTHYLRLVRAWV